MGETEQYNKTKGTGLYFIVQYIKKAKMSPEQQVADS